MQKAHLKKPLKTLKFQRLQGLGLILAPEVIFWMPGRGRKLKESLKKMSMTKKERVLAALGKSNPNEDTIDALIEFAYYMGAEADARWYGDKIREQILEQRKRAADCRYYNMAQRVVGTIDYYNGDYSQEWTEAFGQDLTEL